MADAYQLEATTDRYLLEDGSVLLLEAVASGSLIQGAMIVQMTSSAFVMFGPSAAGNR